jgi:tripartite-type tricarboxylate transporter receptor subunit TctC
MSREGVEPGGGTPAQFAEHIRSEGRKWAPVIKAANIKGE